MDDVKNAPDGSFFLLHPCAHNPTGVDPTEEQWREISYLFKVLQVGTSTGMPDQSGFLLKMGT